MSAAPAGEVQKSCQVSIFKTVIYWPGQPCLEVSGGIWDEQLEDEQSLILFRQSLPSKQPVQVGERSAFSEMETHLKNVDVQPSKTGKYSANTVTDNIRWNSAHVLLQSVCAHQI